jgi:hypothetical protein
MDRLHEVRRALSSEGILMCFNGPFSHSIIEELGKAVRRYLESEELRRSSLMDVFSVYVEATQNVANYANRAGRPEEQRQQLNSGIIVIGRRGDQYLIQSGNPVQPEDAGPLRSRLDQIIALDKTGLKALYKERMRQPLEPGRSGAGLGLIDMARKASEPLTYTFVPGEDGMPFFSLKVIV